MVGKRGLCVSQGPRETFDMRGAAHLVVQRLLAEAVLGLCTAYEGRSWQGDGEVTGSIFFLSSCSRRLG